MSAPSQYLSGKTPNPPVFTPGTRYILLDPVRDAGFLSSPSIVNPSAPVNDGGLGVVDNGIFVYTTALTPGGSGSRRPFPIKFFWIGSPSGTTDATDAFSIYVADVVPSGFYAGAPASAWLVNPRLVLNAAQAKSDVIAWFDVNYPGGASGGVGTTNSGSNTQYGSLAGGTSAVGNVSGIDSLDGQFWPIYDRVDDSWLLYFSVKTPNLNTLSIYCYKIADSEVASPAGSSDFLGGLAGASWVPGVASSGATDILSSHRFSILSPDPHVLAGRTAGQQSAVFVYSYGVFSNTTPDHGASFVFSLLQDIHGSPLTPTMLAITPGSNTQFVDFAGFYPIDKFGQIFAAEPSQHVTPVYGVPYNSPSDRDIRATSSGVVISVMHIRVAYVAAVENHQFAAMFGSDPLLVEDQVPVYGACRPQYTTLPDGIPKLLYANFTPDQNLTLGYVYLDPRKIQPSAHRRLSMYRFLEYGLTFPTLGRRKLRIAAGLKAQPSANPSPAAAGPGFVIQPVEGFGMDYSNGLYNISSTGESLLLFDQPPANFMSGTAAVEHYDSLLVDLVDLPPILRLATIGGGPTEDYLWLED